MAKKQKAQDKTDLKDDSRLRDRDRIDSRSIRRQKRFFSQRNSEILNARRKN